MKRYLVVEALLGPVLRVAMPRAVGSGAFLIRYPSSRGRRRINPVSPQVPVLGGGEVSGCFSTHPFESMWI